jgi:hypothetical protein
MINCGYDPKTGSLYCDRFEITMEAMENYESPEQAVDWVLGVIRRKLLDPSVRTFGVEDKLKLLQARVKKLEDRDLGRPVKLPSHCPECGRKGTVGLGSCEGRPGCSRCLWEFKP